MTLNIISIKFHQKIKNPNNLNFRLFMFYGFLEPKNLGFFPKPFSSAAIDMTKTSPSASSLMAQATSGFYAQTADTVHDDLTHEAALDHRVSNQLQHHLLEWVLLIARGILLMQGVYTTPPPGESG